MPMPSGDSLRCFVAAAETLNFRAAARRVALSPAAFGGRIAQLESELGAALFTRTTRRVSLTLAGEKLLLHARAALAALAACADLRLDADAPRPAYALTLGTRFELGMSWLVPALARLERAQPERQLHLYFGDTDVLVPKVQRQELDAIITSARLGVQALRHAPLHEEHYVFVGASALLRKQPLRAATDAPRHTLLDVQVDLPLFRYLLDARPADEAWSFKHVQHLGTIGAIRARVLEGAGVAVLPHYFVEQDLRKKTMTRLLPRAQMTSDRFRLTWRKGHPREHDLHELAAELAQQPLR